jgi:hypothetical protein
VKPIRQARRYQIGGDGEAYWSRCYVRTICAEIQLHEIRDLYELVGDARNLQLHYNIAPSDTVEAVRPSSGATELVPMRRGLVPYWWKKPVKEMPATFIARAETVASCFVMRPNAIGASCRRAVTMSG